MIRAIRVAELSEFDELQLPGGDAGAQYERLTAAIGGSPQSASYHRSSVVHVHSNGRNEQLRPNLAVWALASSWMKAELPYLLYGPVVITGRRRDGGVGPLPDALAAQVRTACATVRETLHAWRDRPPVSNDAALGELFAYVRRDLDGLCLRTARATGPGACRLDSRAHSTGAQSHGPQRPPRGLSSARRAQVKSPAHAAQVPADGR